MNLDIKLYIESILGLLASKLHNLTRGTWRFYYYSHSPPFQLVSCERCELFESHLHLILHQSFFTCNALQGFGNSQKCSKTFTTSDWKKESQAPRVLVKQMPIEQTEKCTITFLVWDHITGFTQLFSMQTHMSVPSMKLEGTHVDRVVRRSLGERTEIKKIPASVK